MTASFQVLYFWVHCHSARFTGCPVSRITRARCALTGLNLSSLYNLLCKFHFTNSLSTSTVFIELVGLFEAFSCWFQLSYLPEACFLRFPAQSNGHQYWMQLTTKWQYMTQMWTNQDYFHTLSNYFYIFPTVTWAYLPNVFRYFLKMVKK